ncbi:MAG: hypothetical protein WHX93_08170 [bacterium]
MKAIFTSGSRLFCLFLLALSTAACVAETYYYPPPPPSPPPRLFPGDLRVTDLDMRPDPITSGERPRFSVTIFNRSAISGHVRILILDRDEIVAEALGVLLRPGANRVEFPRGSYRFHRSDHCFTVEVDIEGTRHPVDLARRFCARRTPGGWSLAP